MQDNINQLKEYITSLNEEFTEIQGGSFVKLDTGEIFTHTEVQKYIKTKIEKYNKQFIEDVRKTLHETNELELDQVLSNKRSKKPKNKLKLKERYDGGNFNIVYENKILEVQNMKLNNNEKLVYYSIRDFAQYPTNCVIIKDTIPTMIELEPIVGLNEKSIRKALKTLDEKSLVKLVQYGHRKAIYINPEYYATGKDLDIKTLEFFDLIECDDEKINYYIKKNK